MAFWERLLGKKENGDAISDVERYEATKRRLTAFGRARAKPEERITYTDPAIQRAKERALQERLSKFEKTEARFRFRESGIGRFIAALEPARARIAQQRRYAVAGRMPVQQARTQAAVKRLTRAAFPSIPAGLTSIPREYAKTGKKGRPKGAYAGKYAAYGGVYGYRKFMRALRAQQSAQKRLAQLQGVQQQQVPVQYQQVPVQQYQRVPVQQVYQQVPVYPQATMPQEPTKRPIITPFRGAGGKPYPAVNDSPKLSDIQAPPGYAVSVDMFTGRRILKPLPRTEAWIAPRR